MKKLFLLLAIVTFVTQSHAQSLKEKEVPMAVKKAFMKDNPKIMDAKWSKDGKNFEAEFVINGVPTAETYYANGKLKEDETEMEVSALPQSIKDYVKANYKGAKIKEASKLLSKGITTYEAEVNGKDLIFSANGKYLKTMNP